MPLTREQALEFLTQEFLAGRLKTYDMRDSYIGAEMEIQRPEKWNEGDWVKLEDIPDLLLAIQRETARECLGAIAEAAETWIRVKASPLRVESAEYIAVLVRDRFPGATKETP